MMLMIIPWLIGGYIAIVIFWECLCLYRTWEYGPMYSFHEWHASGGVTYDAHRERFKTENAALAFLYRAFYPCEILTHYPESHTYYFERLPYIPEEEDA